MSIDSRIIIPIVSGIVTTVVCLYQRMNYTEKENMYNNEMVKLQEKARLEEIAKLEEREKLEEKTRLEEREKLDEKVKLEGKAKLKTKYDMALNIDRANHLNWNFALPSNYLNFSEEPMLVVAFVGYFKVGKTHHMNKMFDVNIPLWHSSVEGNWEDAVDTFGISMISPSADVAGGNLLVLDCAGKDSAIDWQERGSQVKFTQQIDDFTLNIAMAVADVVIVCVERVGIETTNFIRLIQKKLQEMEVPGFDKLFVLHNYKDISSKSQAYGTFQKYVTGPLHAKKITQNVNLTSGVMKLDLWISKFDDLKFPTHHLLLGREDEESGNSFNQNAYDLIKTHLACMRARATSRNVVTDLVSAMNKEIGAIEELAKYEIELDDTNRINSIESQQ